MKPDPLTLKYTLRKRELELQKIIRQMKEDKLIKSPVFRNLEQELDLVKGKLTATGDQNFN